MPFAGPVSATGAVAARPDPTGDPDHDPVWESAVDYILKCGSCGETWRTGARSALVGHPVTVSLLYEAGVDYRTVPFWEQTWLTEAEERVTGEDPLRVAVETTIDDEHLLFTVDETDTVVDHGRDDTT